MWRSGVWNRWEVWGISRGYVEWVRFVSTLTLTHGAGSGVLSLGLFNYNGVSGRSWGRRMGFHQP